MQTKEALEDACNQTLSISEEDNTRSGWRGMTIVRGLWMLGEKPNLFFDYWSMKAWCITATVFVSTVMELVLSQMGTDGFMHFSTFPVSTSWDDSEGRSWKR